MLYRIESLLMKSFLQPWVSFVFWRKIYFSKGNQETLKDFLSSLQPHSMQYGVLAQHNWNPPSKKFESLTVFFANRSLSKALFMKMSLFQWNANGTQSFQKLFKVIKMRYVNFDLKRPRVKPQHKSHNNCVLKSYFVNFELLLNSVGILETFSGIQKKFRGRQSSSKAMTQMRYTVLV